MKHQLSTTLVAAAMALSLRGVEGSMGSCDDSEVASCLLLTGVIDGPLSGGTPKAVEVYAACDVADLSEYGLGSPNNGGGTDGIEFDSWSGSVNAGEFIYVSYDTTQFNNWFGFGANYTSSASSINGDDGVELFRNGKIVDIFGDANDAETEGWGYVDGWVYRVSGTGPCAGDFSTGCDWIGDFLEEHWMMGNENALDNYDSQADTAGIDDEFPAGTYSTGKWNPCSNTQLEIKRDNSALTLGEDSDVRLARTSKGRLTMFNNATIMGDLAVRGNFVAKGDATLQNVDVANATVSGFVDMDGDLTVGGTTTIAGLTTVQGHLEVDETISTGFGRITRDFHQFYTTTRAAAYYNIKTSIPSQSNTMYRIEVLGYAYGSSASVDSVTVGYTYQNWDCQGQDENIDFGVGTINVYCSTDDYLVVQYYCADTYFMGLTFSGWFLNPAGTAHDIEVLDSQFTTTEDYFSSASSRRELQVEDPGQIVDDDGQDSNVARPLETESSGRTFSVREMSHRVEEQEAEIATLKQEVEELKALVAALALA